MTTSPAMICCSHSPLLLGFLPSKDKDAEAGFYRALDEAADWLKEFDPELIVVFGPDHFTGLFYDMMPAFCIGAAAESSRDWDIEPGPLDVPGDVALACHGWLNDHGFDPAMSYRLVVDHGTTIPLLKLVGALDAYPVLPIVVNCAAITRPSLGRMWEFGAEVGRFLATLDKRVMVIGSGGLSHDPPTPALDLESPAVIARVVDRHVATKEDFDRRQARVIEAARDLAEGRESPCMAPSEDWDRAFLAALEKGGASAFDAFTDEMIDRDGGFGGHEVRTWVAAAAAMTAMGSYKLDLDYYRIIPEWITGMAVARGYPAQ